MLFSVSSKRAIGEMLTVNVFTFFVFQAALGHPAFDELMEEQSDDTAVVESVVREARAVGPSHIDDLLGPGKFIKRLSTSVFL